MHHLEQRHQKLAGGTAAHVWSRVGPSAWWIVGVILGFSVVGPAWSGDALLNLDLVVFDRMVVSPGVWGLGPELPRQSPVIVVLASMSRIVDGTSLVAGLMVVVVAAAFVGAARLSRPAPWHARAAAGLLYAFGPWLVTRLAVGHLGLAVSAAMLPWLLPVLLRPDRSLRRTFLAAAAMGLGGFYGGSLALVVLAVGVATGRGHRAPQVAAAWVVSQLPWIVPGAIVGMSTPRIAGGEFFRTTIDGVGDLLRLVLGYGFWQRGNQLGLESALLPVAALVVLIVALAGVGRHPDGHGRRSAVLGVTGIVIASATAVPVLGDVFEWASTSLPGGIVREPQRMLVLFLVWLAPATAAGIARLDGRSPTSGLAASACCAMIATVTISPALWGAGGRLDGVDLPGEWERVQRLIDAEPGTTLALPWNQYFDLEVAGGRRTYHPVTGLIRSDVLNAADPEFGPSISEAVDPRTPSVDVALDRFDRGEPFGEALDEIGVRWIVVVTGVDDDRYGRLAAEEGLRPRIEHDSIVLYEVLSWSGPARTAAGEPADVDAPIPPFAAIDDDAVVWFAPAAPGWRRGFDATGTTPAGVLALPTGSGPVWYWPTLLVLLGDLVTVGGVVAAAWPFLVRWRRRVRDGVDKSSGNLAQVSGSP